MAPPDLVPGRFAPVPVRTDSAWFHETLSRDAGLYLLKGRVRFLDAAGGRQPTPFSLMLVVLGATVDQKSRLTAEIEGFWIERAA